MPGLDTEGLGQKNNMKALVELVKIILAMAVLSPVVSYPSTSLEIPSNSDHPTNRKSSK
jgi:hypothetical protein